MLTSYADVWCLQSQREQARADKKELLKEEKKQLKALAQVLNLLALLAQKYKYQH
jgi:hypothetical protein